MSRLSTRTRIIAATFAPLLLFVMLGAGAALFAIPRIIEGLVLQRQTALAEVAAAGVAGEMQGHLRLLLGTADDIGAVVGESPSADAIAVQQLLARRAMLLEVFTGGMAYVGADGTLVATGPGAEGQVGQSFGHAAYLQRVFASRAPVFSSVVDDQPDRHRSVMVAMPGSSHFPLAPPTVARCPTSSTSLTVPSSAAAGGAPEASRVTATARAAGVRMRRASHRPGDRSTVPRRGAAR